MICFYSITIEADQPHRTAQIAIIGNINTQAAKNATTPIKPSSLAHAN